MKAERYQKETRLSRDPEGTTWRAQDSRTGFSVAVKELTFNSSDGEDATDLRSLQSARESLEGLHHSGLPALLDHYEEDEVHGVVCEWVEGRSLARHVDGDTPLAADDALRLLQSSLDVLDHLHSQDHPVLHGDIHPGNLIVDAGGKLHIVGFPGLDLKMGTAGTGPCAAPEATRGEPEPASDLYALGLSLCAAITGTRVEALPCVPGWGGKRLVLDRVLPSSPLRDVLQSLVEPDRRRRPGSVAEARKLVDSALEREALLLVAEGRTSEARQRAAGRAEARQEEPVLKESPNEPARGRAEVDRAAEEPTGGQEESADESEEAVEFDHRPGSPPWRLMGVTALVVGLAWFVYQGDPPPPPEEAPQTSEAPDPDRGTAPSPVAPETAQPGTAESRGADLAVRCKHLRESGGLGAWSQLLRDAPEAPCAPEARAAILSGLGRPAVRSVSSGSVILGERAANEEGLSVAVISRAYDFSTTEVTRHLYREVMKDGAHEGGDCDLCPMDEVSWNDAMAFANALSRKEGLNLAYSIEGELVTWDREANGYRLPTSAEWERAARVLDWPEQGDERHGVEYVGPDSMNGGVSEWVWDSFATQQARKPSKKNRVKWAPVSEPTTSPTSPTHHPDCLQGGGLFGPDFPGSPGFASSLAGQESSRAPLGRKRAIAVEPPGASNVGAVVSIRHGRTDKLRRRLTGHTNTQVFARALQSAWILSYAVDGELRLWDPRKGGLVASDRYIGGDLSPQGDPAGQIYVAQAGNGQIAVMSPRFLTVWRWDRKNRRSKPFLDLVPPAWDPAVIGGMLPGPEGQLASVKDEVVTLWDADGTEKAKLDAHEGTVRGAQTVGGALLATWSDDHAIRLWSWAGDPRAVLVGHESPVLCLEELPKNRLVSRDQSGRAVLWDTKTGHALAVLAPLSDAGEILVARPGIKAFKRQMKHRSVDPAPNATGADRTIRGKRGGPPGARSGASVDTRRPGLGFRLVRSR